MTYFLNRCGVEIITASASQSEDQDSISRSSHAIDFKNGIYPVWRSTIGANRRIIGANVTRETEFTRS